MERGGQNSERDMEKYAHDDIDGGTDFGAFAFCVVEGGGVFSGVGVWECGRRWEGEIDSAEEVEDELMVHL